MHVMMTVNTAWNIVNFRRPLVEALRASGHEVTVLAASDEAVPVLESLGCRVIGLDLDAKGLSPVEALPLIYRFIRVFRAQKPDVILSYTIKNNLFGAIAAKLTGRRFIPNVTGLGTAFLSGWLLRHVALILYARAFAGLPAVFFQNTDDRDLFLHHGLIRPAQARMLPGSGIDLERFSAAPYPEGEEGPVFLMIARVLRDKGVLEYVEAARLLREKLPAARFRLLGAVDTANRSAIDRQTVESWVNDGLIDYLGTSNDVRPEIARAHCVVLPSYREGAPRTLIEAAAMARPLIATDVPGCRSVVEDGKTGFLCAVRSGTDLARACLEFAALPLDARSAMGQKGRDKMAAEFDQRLVVAAYERAIADVTGQTARQAMRQTARAGI